MWFLILLALMVPASAQSFGDGFANAFATQQALNRGNPYLYEQLRQQQQMREQQQQLNRQLDMIEENNRILQQQENRYWTHRR